MGVLSPRSIQSLQGSGVPIQATTAAGNSLVLSAGPCLFFSAYVVADASHAGWLLVYDLAAAPADGAVTPFMAVPVAANAGNGGLPSPFAHPCQNGCVLVFSTTGPFSQTTSVGTAQFLSGQAT